MSEKHICIWNFKPQMRNKLRVNVCGISVSSWYLYCWNLSLKGTVHCTPLFEMKCLAMWTINGFVKSCRLQSQHNSFFSLFANYLVTLVSSLVVTIIYTKNLLMSPCTTIQCMCVRLSVFCLFVCMQTTSIYHSMCSHINTISSKCFHTKMPLKYYTYTPL